MSEPDNQPDQIDIMDEQELRTEFRALVSRLGMANMEADKQRAENKELSSRLSTLGDSSLLVREIVAFFDVLANKYGKEATGDEEWPTDWLRRAKGSLK